MCRNKILGFNTFMAVQCSFPHIGAKRAFANIRKRSVYDILDISYRKLYLIANHIKFLTVLGYLSAQSDSKELLHENGDCLK